MDAQGWAIVIGSSTLGLTGIVSAIFAGLTTLRQLPQVVKSTNEAATQSSIAAAESATVSRKVDNVTVLVNGHTTKLQEEIAKLHDKLEQAHEDARILAREVLAKAEHEEHVQQVQVMNPDPLPVKVVEEDSATRSGETGR